MEPFTAQWVQVTLAALSVVALAGALVTTLKLRTIRDESELLGDSDTKTIVKFRLLESRVSELETSLAALELWRDSVVGVPNVVDLRAELTGAGRNAEPRIVRLTSAGH